MASVLLAPLAFPSLHATASIRNIALSKINDERVYKQAAIEDSDFTVGKFALSHITSLEDIYLIALNSKCMETRYISTEIIEDEDQKFLQICISNNRYVFDQVYFFNFLKNLFFFFLRRGIL